MLTLRERPPGAPAPQVLRLFFSSVQLVCEHKKRHTTRIVPGLPTDWRCSSCIHMLLQEQRITADGLQSRPADCCNVWATGAGLMSYSVTPVTTPPPHITPREQANRKAGGRAACVRVRTLRCSAGRHVKLPADKSVHQG